MAGTPLIALLKPAKYVRLFKRWSPTERISLAHAQLDLMSVDAGSCLTVQRVSCCRNMIGDAGVLFILVFCHVIQCIPLTHGVNYPTNFIIFYLQQKVGGIWFLRITSVRLFVHLSACSFFRSSRCVFLPIRMIKFDATLYMYS